MLSLIHCPDSLTLTLQSPTPILPASCFIGAITWDIEKRVSDSNVGVQVPPRCSSNRLFVPETLHSQVIHWGHTSRISCHPGVRGTIFIIKQRFGWQSMERDVKGYMSACPEYVKIALSYCFC